MRGKLRCTHAGLQLSRVRAVRGQGIGGSAGQVGLLGGVASDRRGGVSGGSGRRGRSGAGACWPRARAQRSSRSSRCSPQTVNPARLRSPGLVRAPWSGSTVATDWFRRPQADRSAQQPNSVYETPDGSPGLTSSGFAQSAAAGPRTRTVAGRACAETGPQGPHWSPFDTAPLGSPKRHRGECIFESGVTYGKPCPLA